jgi:hypothetical protein
MTASPRVRQQYKHTIANKSELLFNYTSVMI